MKRLLMGLVAVLMGGVMVATPVMAERCPDGTTPVAILGGSGDVTVLSDGTRCMKDDGKGSGVKHILQLVVEVMTIGIGVLGVLGITIVGIQYLTAGGSEEKTRKAKRRLFEIVIGLVAYVVLFSAMAWLIPDFDPFGW